MLQWLEDVLSSPAFSNKNMERIIQLKNLEVQNLFFVHFKFSLSPDLVTLKNNIIL